jgi:putative NADPH-quinone reductase
VNRRIAVIQGHPDPAGHRPLHAMADAYAEAAIAAGHEIRRIEVGKLEFTLLRTQVDFETGALPPALAQPREDMRWAEHWLFLFPLWHRTMPALFKGFLELILGMALPRSTRKRVFRNDCLPPFSSHRRDHGDAVMLYRWYFGAYGLRVFERTMLSFAGIKPIRESLYGLSFADEKKRSRWIEDMRKHGRRGD